MPGSDRMAGGFGFPLGCLGVVAAAVASDLAGAAGHPWYALVPLGAVVATTAVTSTARAAAAVAAVAWAVDSGFIVGRAGRLAFDAAAGLAALVLGLALLAALLVGWLRDGRRPTWSWPRYGRSWPGWRTRRSARSTNGTATTTA